MVSPSFFLLVRRSFLSSLLFPRPPIVLRSFVPWFAAAYQYFPLSVSPRESIGTARRGERERERPSRSSILYYAHAPRRRWENSLRRRAAEKSFSGRFPPQLSWKEKSEINNNHNGKQRVANRGRVSMARISDYTFSLT